MIALFARIRRYSLCLKHKSTISTLTAARKRMSIKTCMVPPVVRVLKQFV
jgi:hypothetical protein